MHHWGLFLPQVGLQKVSRAAPKIFWTSIWTEKGSRAAPKKFLGSLFSTKKWRSWWCRFGGGVRPTYLFFGDGENPDLPTSFLELNPPPKGVAEIESAALYIIT